MTLIRDGFQSADLDVPVVLPTLNLDFANSQSLDERITFTRGSTGTFVNKNGLIENVDVNIPRFDYDPISGECKGLLIEESRQNLFTNSNDFTVWTKQTSGTGVVGITTNAVTSPDGTTNATRYFIQNGGGTFYSIYRGVTGILANTSYSYSVFVKGSTTVPVPASSFTLVVFDGAIASFVTYNLNTGTIQSSFANTNLTIGSNSTITNYGNGWYRCVFVFSHSVGGNGFQFKADMGGTRHNQELFIYGAQVEQGAFPTSYIPTGASTVTRSADNASITGTNFSSVFGSGTPSELSVFYSGLAPYASINGAYYWQLTDNAITERIIFRYAGLPQILLLISGTSSAIGGVFANATQIVNMKSVGLIDNKSFAIRVNDGNPDYQFTNNLKLPRIPTGFQQLNIGSSHNGFNYLNGTIRKLAFYPKRLSSSQAVYLIQ